MAQQRMGVQLPAPTWQFTNELQGISCSGHHTHTWYIDIYESKIPIHVKEIALIKKYMFGYYDT